jgi:anti-anti-sigma factor
MASGFAYDAQRDFRPDLQIDADTAPPGMTVSGELDAVNADELRSAVADVLRRHRPERVDIDMHGVTFLDSAGIRALLLCQAEAQRVDCRITLSRPRPGVYRVLEVTGLLDHFGLQARRPAYAPEVASPSIAQ